MNPQVHQYENIVEECDGCVYCGPRIVGGDKSLICRRHPWPHIKWLCGEKCENYKEKD